MSTTFACPYCGDEVTVDKVIVWEDNYKTIKGNCESCGPIDVDVDDNDRVIWRG